MDWRCDSVAECLPSIPEALGFISSTEVTPILLSYFKVCVYTYMHMVERKYFKKL
jgi:hypothetical protein